MNVMLLGRLGDSSGPGGLSTIASVSAGGAASLEALYNKGYHAAIAAGMSEADAKAAGGAAVRSQGASIIDNTNARVAQAIAENQVREMERLLQINAERQRSTEAALVVANARSTSNVEMIAEDSGLSFIPIALGVSALAYFMFKG